MSPAAEAMRSPQNFAWGIILLVAWGLPSLLAAMVMIPKYTEAFLGLQVLCGLVGLVGAVLLYVGIRDAIRARRFNAQDWAMADALVMSMRDLWSQPPEVAYHPVPDETQIIGARLIEVQRHFDSQTQGAITGAMVHRLRMFGVSFSAAYGVTERTSVGAGVFSGWIRGLSKVDLDVSLTTRNNLMGDALFAVLEAPGPAGERDTYRVVSMSQPAVASWIHDLAAHAAQQFGGPSTHAGATLLQLAQNLQRQFISQDITYVTDRLKALEARPAHERETVSVRGIPIGRNAIIATAVTIGHGPELRLMPSRLPELLGHAVAIAMANTERQLAAPQPAQLPAS